MLRGVSIPVPSAKVGLAAAFAGLAIYSSYKYFAYQKALKSSLELTSVKPSLEKNKLVAVMKEIDANAKKIVAAVESGSKMIKPSAEEKKKLQDVIASAIRMDVAEMQLQVCDKHGVKLSDVTAAQQYYGHGGPGQDAAVVAATTAIMKTLGRHMMTRRRLFRAVREMHAFQLSITREVVEEALALTGGEVQSMKFVKAMQEIPTRKIGVWLEQNYGWTENAAKLIELGASAEVAAEDPEFFAAFRTMLESEGKKLMASSQQTMQQVMMEMAMASGGMGGGMGF